MGDRRGIDNLGVVEGAAVEEMMIPLRRILAKSQRPSLVRMNGDRDSGVELWEVLRQGIWLAIETVGSKKLSHREPGVRTGSEMVMIPGGVL